MYLSIMKRYKMLVNETKSLDLVKSVVEQVCNWRRVISDKCSTFLQCCFNIAYIRGSLNIVLSQWRTHIVSLYSGVRLTRTRRLLVFVYVVSRAWRIHSFLALRVFVISSWLITNWLNIIKLNCVCVELIKLNCN